MNRRTIFIICLLFIATAGYSSETFFKLPDDPLKGFAVFTKKRCIDCHSLKQGEPAFGPDLRNSLRSNDILQIYGKMWSHSLQMFRYMDEREIPHPQFDKQEFKELLDFLYVLNFLSEKGSTEKGKEFFNKNVCSQCHYIGIYGNTSGISLDGFKIYMSPVGLASALWNHGNKMTTQVSLKHINWPVLEGGELSALSEFIKDFSREISAKEVFSSIGSPVKGRRIFLRYNCKQCHSERNFISLSRKNVLEISAAMWNNGPKMWSRMNEIGYTIPEFTPDEFIDLTSYIYFIQYPWERGSREEGKRIFEKNCSQCHTKGPGPSLNSIKGRYRPIEFMLTIWNHTENMHEIAKEKGISWPRFLGKEMNDLVEFMAIQ